MNRALVSGIVAIAAVALACGPSSPLRGEAVPLPGTHRVTTEGSYRTASDLQALTRSSDVIVVGRVSSLAGTYNLARSQSDPTQPAANAVIEAVTYRVQVEETIMGTSAREIVVAVPRARSFLGRPVVQDPGFIPMTIAARYVLFLERIPGTDILGQAPEPFRFELTTAATPVSPWIGAATAFPSRSTQQFLVDVRAAARQR